MNSRINLFRQLLKESVGAANPSVARPAVKLDKRIGIAAGALAGFVFLVVPSYLKANRMFEENHVKALAMEAEIAQITVEAEEKARLAQEKKKQERERIAQGKTPAGAVRTLSSQPSPGLNDTWTSILWKLTTFTPPQIIIDRMDLTKGSGASLEGATLIRQAALEGQATSLQALQRWLEGISLNLPNSDFILDRQVVGTGPFPIYFKVTARFL